MCNQKEIEILEKFKNHPLDVYTKDECEIINNVRDKTIAGKIPEGDSCICPYKIMPWDFCNVAGKTVKNNVKICGIKNV